MIHYNKRLQATALFLAALLLVLMTLFLGKDVSLGDNGDFFRIIDLCSMKLDSQRNGLIDLEDQGLLRNILTVLTDHKDLDEYPTSHIIPIRLSVITNLIANALLGAPVETYRLSHLAVIYSLFYAAAVAFALTGIPFRRNRSRWCFYAAALVILCDIGYTSYFASFYGEALQQILLILSVGFLIRAAVRRPRLREALGGFAGLFLFGISKPFNIPPAIVMCVLYLLLLLRSSDSRQRLRFIALCLAAVVLLVFFMAIIPNWMGNQTNYNAVFYGILRDTDEATSREYLSELGLDPDMAQLRNTNFYVSDIHAYSLNYDIYSPGRLGYLDLALFYLKHPIFTFRKFPVMMAYAGTARNIFFLDSHLVDDPGRLSIWSLTREHIGFDGIPVNLSIVVVFFCVLWLALPRESRNRRWSFLIPLCIFLALAYAMILPFVTNGEGDLAKHMFLFVEFIDLMLLFVLLRSLDQPRQAWSFAAICAAVLLSGLPLSTQPEIVSFGGYEWYVIEETEHTQTLLCAESAASMPYDADNRNYYAESDLRTWLNGPFLDAFSHEERSQLLVQEHKVLHSVADKASADVGFRDFYCTPYPALAGNNYPDAYGSMYQDLVTVPSVAQISELAQRNLSVALDGDYWLETPYFSNGQRVRFQGKDGMIYFANASTVMDVRPMICIRK